MAYDKNKRFSRPAPEKQKCWRIGCDRPVLHGCLCKRHEAERLSLGQSTDLYVSLSCLDKSRETVKDRSAKKKRTAFRRPSDNDDD